MGEFRKVWTYGSDYPHKGDEVFGLIHNETGHFIAIETKGRFARYRVVRDYKTYRRTGRADYVYSIYAAAVKKARESWTE